MEFLFYLLFVFSTGVLIRVFMFVFYFHVVFNRGMVCLKLRGLQKIKSGCWDPKPQILQTPIQSLAGEHGHVQGTAPDPFE